MKLTKDDILKWVKALRSGEYKQGRNWLCIDDKDGNPHFCCLGVACDLFLEGYWEPAIDRRQWIINNQSYFPPQELAAAIDKVLYHHACNRLAEMNDEGISFDKIADRIEEYAGLR